MQHSNSVAHCISGDAGDTEEEIGSVGITMAWQLKPTCCVLFLGRMNKHPFATQGTVTDRGCHPSPAWEATVIIGLSKSVGG